MTSPERFPPLCGGQPQAPGAELTVPARLAVQMQARGATLTTVVDASAKAAHGRYERRDLWALADPGWTAYAGTTGTVGEPWPHLQQLLRIERRRIIQRTGETSTEVTSGITSLPPNRADATRLLALSRQSWGIENRSHWVRDGTVAEDRCQIRTGAAPQAFAACRNLAITLLRRVGVTTIAAALRTCAGRPRTALHIVLGAATE